VYDGPSAEKKIQKDYSTLYAKAKQEIKPKIQDKTQIYCHYCDTGTPITLYRNNDSYRLWQHLETNMHKNNVIYEKSNPSKRLHTTFLNFEICYGYYSKSFAALAQYGTSTNNYKILLDDNLFDKKIKTHGYIKSNKCEGYTTSKYCFECGNLAQSDAVQKRNRRYQELITQIDCLLLLKEGQPIPASIISQFGNSWIQFDVKKLYDTVISSLKNRPGNTRSTELQQLFKYVEKEMSDHSYYTTINKYPALRHIIEAVETNGLENCIGQCITFLVDKTMEKNRPVFVEMAQAVTKVIDKMQCGITTMRGIGEYHESFIDFLIVLISISTLAIHIITIWREAYNYAGHTICAKDQMKVAELIEVCRHQQKWIGCVPIDNTTIPTTMTIEELHNKISNFKKATYITVYALSACIPGIPPVVIAVNPSDQTEKAEINVYDNNLIMRELNRVGAMTVGLYFDDATHDRNWLGEVYSENPVFIQELELKQ
ncbi:3973_t:CDS:2, partial [Funneliformis geosporum]